MSCIHFNNDSPGSVGNLTSSTDAENVKGDGDDTDTDTAKDHIAWSLILGQKENGSSEEIHSQKDISVVINAEKKLEAHNEWWHTAMLIFADIVGSGIIALPGAFARIGWFFGILLLIVCYLMYVTSLCVRL